MKKIKSNYLLKLISIFVVVFSIRNGEWTHLKSYSENVEFRIDSRGFTLKNEKILTPIVKTSPSFNNPVQFNFDNTTNGYERAVGDENDVVSPIILDLNKNGIKTTTMGEGVYFDHDGDGLKENSGWIAGGDALLVRDFNSDGKINNGSELFGNNTLLKDGKKAVHGFEALMELDDNNDGVLDKKDVAFDSLLVWQDQNGNGITDKGELKTLSEVGIVSISTYYKNINKTDAQGNQHRETSTIIFEDGSVSIATDVWFKISLSKHIEDGSITPSINALMMPDAKGFGKVHDLQEAMTLDPALIKLVQAVIGEKDTSARSNLLDTMIYRWAGVELVDPYSRDNTIFFSDYPHVIDARQLEALEAFIGEGFLGTWGNGIRDPNPHRKAATILILEYRKIKYFTEAQLLAYTDHTLILDVVDSFYFFSGRTPFIVNWEKLADKLNKLIDDNKSIRALEIINTLDHLGAYFANYRDKKQQIMDSGSDFGVLLKSWHDTDYILTITQNSWPTGAIDANKQNEKGQAGIIYFSSDISAESILLFRQDNSLIVRNKMTNQELTIENYFTTTGINLKGIKAIQFARESEIWYPEQINVMLVQDADDDRFQHYSGYDKR